jgi:N-acetylglucosaminyl-diphospho-decaprenol L-rhamnosyltransferase
MALGGRLQVTISVIIVTYRSADVLYGCLDSVPPGVEIVIVSQDGTDDAASVSRSIRPDAKIIAAGRNRGFGAGCNLGAANATGDTVVFLNPDARLVADSLTRLAETSRASGGTLTGPRILDAAGAEITRARNWSSLWTDVVDLLIPVPLQPRRWRRDISHDDDVYRFGGGVPYIQGACMAVGRKRFVELGGFDEAFFLYGEEEYLARKLACSGQSAMLDAHAWITHAQHTSLAKTGAFAVEQYFRTRALTYRRDSHLADRGFAFGAIRTLPMACSLLFLLISTPLRARIKYRRVEDAAWCHAALQGLWRGLLRRPVSGPDPAA